MDEGKNAVQSRLVDERETCLREHASELVQGEDCGGQVIGGGRVIASIFVGDRLGMKKIKERLLILLLWYWGIWI